MRIFQIVVFVLASMSFLAALYFTGQDAGDTFWRGGMAGMIGAIVLILLWPTRRRR
jgi:Na+/H+ antiporter NhaC